MLPQETALRPALKMAILSRRLFKAWRYTDFIGTFAYSPVLPARPTAIAGQGLYRPPAGHALKGFHLLFMLYLSSIFQCTLKIIIR